MKWISDGCCHREQRNFHMSHAHTISITCNWMIHSVDARWRSGTRTRAPARARAMWSQHRRHASAANTHSTHWINEIFKNDNNIFIQWAIRAQSVVNLNASNQSDSRLTACRYGNNLRTSLLPRFEHINFPIYIFLGDLSRNFVVCLFFSSSIDHVRLGLSFAQWW